MVDTVKTVKSAGGDYNSLNQWEGLQQKVIAAGDTEQAECYAFVDTTAVTIDGWTTVATGYIRIYTPSAERHNGTAGTGYRLNTNTAFVNTLTIVENYVRVEGISFNQAASGDVIRKSFSGTHDVRIEQCIVTGATASGIVNGGGLMKIGNCFLFGITGTAIVSTFDSASPTTHVHNCTITNSGTGISRDSGTTNAKNCYVQATTEYSGTITRTTCVHASATVYSGSTASVAYNTTNFTNVTAGSENLHIPSGSALKDAGTDLSADANYPISVDIDGVARSGTWDIGADEFVAAGGPTTWTYTPSGGIVIAGTAPLQKGKIGAVSGGFVLSGTAPRLHGHVPPTSGGYNFGGTSPVALGKVFTPTGGIVFAGQAGYVFDDGSVVPVPAGRLPLTGCGWG